MRSGSLNIPRWTSRITASSRQEAWKSLYITFKLSANAMQIRLLYWLAFHILLCNGVPRQTGSTPVQRQHFQTDSPISMQRLLLTNEISCSGVEVACYDIPSKSSFGEMVDGGQPPRQVIGLLVRRGLDDRSASAHRAEKQRYGRQWHRHLCSLWRLSSRQQQPRVRSLAIGRQI